MRINILRYVADYRGKYKLKRMKIREMARTLGTDEKNVRRYLNNLEGDKYIRSVLFVYWKQKGEHGEFEDFYLQWMRQFMTNWKSQS